MKAECSVEKIKEALTQVERITGKNLTLPILSAILIIVSKNQCKLRSTNLSIGIEIDIPAKVTEEGVVAVKGDIISQFFNTIKTQGTITLESVNDNLIIKTKESSSTIKCLPSEDFPTIPVVESNEYSISGKKFIEGLRSVYYSASLSDIKPEIASIYIYKNSEDLVFVATDSFRLAEKKVKLNTNIEFPEILLPFKNTVEIIRVLQESTGDIFIKSTKTQISFTDKERGIYLTSRIIDGIFPDYKQILPKEYTTEVTVLKQDLLQALKLSNIFSDKFNQIVLKVNIGEKFLEINSKNNDVGENTVKVGIKCSGEDISMSFNQKYFLDCFQSISEDTVVLHFTQTNRPMTIQGGAANSFLYLVMPLNR